MVIVRMKPATCRMLGMVGHLLGWSKKSWASSIPVRHAIPANQPPKITSRSVWALPVALDSSLIARPIIQ